MKSLLSCFAALSLFAALTARASTVDTFTLTSVSNGSVVTFQIPGTTSSTVVGGGFMLDNINTSAGLRNITFYDASDGGGLSLDTSGLPYGPQLFTGPDNNPTFLLNTYQLSNNPDLSTNDYSLSITQVGTTPEPSSLLMLGTGALAICGVMRRKVTV